MSIGFPWWAYALAFAGLCIAAAGFARELAFFPSAPLERPESRWDVLTDDELHSIIYALGEVMHAYPPRPCRAPVLLVELKAERLSRGR